MGCAYQRSAAAKKRASQGLPALASAVSSCGVATGNQRVAASRRRRRTPRRSVAAATTRAHPAQRPLGVRDLRGEQRREGHERHDAERALLGVEAEQRRDEQRERHRSAAAARAPAARAAPRSRRARRRAPRRRSPPRSGRPSRRRARPRATPPAGRASSAGRAATTSAPLTPWSRTFTQWCGNGALVARADRPEGAPDEVGERTVRADACGRAAAPRSRGGRRRSQPIFGAGVGDGAHVGVREQRLLLVEDEVRRTGAA